MTNSRLPAGLFVLAFSLYVLTATPGAFWLDSSELAAAGVTLGIPHAPGHPLYVILAYMSSLIPLGSVGFRVALLSALCGAACVVLLYEITCAIIPEPQRGRSARAFAAIAALTFALSDALWFQSVRAEVYTLHTAIALTLVWLLLKWDADEQHNAKLLAIGAFLVGLGAGNHHLLLLALCPALALLLLATPPRRRRILSALPQLMLIAAAGLAIYALLPIRAASEPLINYGHPDTLARFLDVLMARVFVASVTGVEPAYLENINGALDMFMAAIGPLWLLLALAGCVLLWRRQPRLGAFFGLAIALNLATKIMMVLDPTNPDAAGYFQLSIALTLALACVALCALVSAHRLGLHAASLCTSLALILTLALLPLQRADLSHLKGPELVDTATHRDAAPGALVMTSFFAHHFNSLYQRAVAGYRPDLLIVHQGFEDHIDGGRPLSAALKKRAPDLAPVLEAKVATGAFPVEALSALSKQRPVLLEPTLGLPCDYDRLRYKSGLFALEARGSEELEAQVRHEESLLRALGPEAQEQRETLTTLAMTWLPTAVTRLRQGSWRGAQSALDSTNKLSPGSRWVSMLQGPTTALRGAVQSGDRDVIRATRLRLNATDFRGLFGP